MSGTPSRETCGISSSTSAVSPELEIASSTSSRVIMPMSPWLASAACMKNDGVPVEASVAAILPAMWPDLPMPVTMTRPLHSRQIVQARANDASSRGSSAASARPSISMARRPAAISEAGSVFGL